MLLLWLASPPALAHQPVIEKNASIKDTASIARIYPQAEEVTDPTVASVAIYGRLSYAGEIDLYTFVAARTENIPVEALVPLRPFNRDFRPALAVIGPAIASATQPSLPFPLPEGSQAIVIAPPEGERGLFSERYSQERLYRGREEWITVNAGQRYYVAVFEPNRNTGSYSLGLGTVENFANTSYRTLLGNIVNVKLGLFGGRTLPGWDLLGLLLHLAGFTFGMGAVVLTGAVVVSTGVDAVAGAMLAKIGGVARWFYWFGLMLAITGATILYRTSWLSGVALFQLIIALILIFNGIYFSQKVGARSEHSYSVTESYAMQTRRLRKKIGLTITLAIVGWGLALFFTCWYLLLLR